MAPNSIITATLWLCIAIGCLLGLPKVLGADPLPPQIHEYRRFIASCLNESCNEDFAKGKHDICLMGYAEAIRIDPRPIYFFNRAARLAAIGRDSDAIKDYAMALQTTAKEADALPPANVYLARAVSYAKLGLTDLATQDLTIAVTIDGQQDAAYFARGLIHARKNDWELALRDFNRFVELNPRSLVGLRTRAAIQRSRGQVALQLSDYEKASALEPRNWAVHLEIARIRSSSPDELVRDGKSALQHAKTACEITNEKNPSCLDALAMALAETSAFEGAAATAIKALAITEDKQLREEIEKRLTLFRSGKKFRDGTSGPTEDLPGIPSVNAIGQGIKAPTGVLVIDADKGATLKRPGETDLDLGKNTLIVTLQAIDKAIDVPRNWTVFPIPRGSSIVLPGDRVQSLKNAPFVAVTPRP